MDPVLVVLSIPLLYILAAVSKKIGKVIGVKTGAVFFVIAFWVFGFGNSLSKGESFVQLLAVLVTPILIVFAFEALKFSMRWAYDILNEK